MAGDSLFIGVSGLDAYQDQIDVISNNIANIGTTGFKGQDVTFQDLLYQTQSFASAPTAKNGGVDATQTGLGVKVATTSTDYSQGGLQTTGVNTDLAINGDGFFVLGDLSATTSVATNPVYTRDGAFSLNENGVLYDPASGKAVLGFAANSAGIVTPTSSPGILQIPLGLKSQAVGTGFGAKSGPTGDKVFDVSFGGNLNQANFLSAATPGGVAQATTISTTLYDSLGNAHLVNIAFTPFTAGMSATPSSTGTKAFGLGVPQQVANSSGALTTVSTEWQYTVTPTDGTVLTNNTGYAFFDQNGQFINTSSVPSVDTAVAGYASTALAPGASVSQAVVAPSAAPYFLDLGYTGQAAGQNISITFKNAAGVTTTLPFSTTTSPAGTVVTGPITGSGTITVMNTSAANTVTISSMQTNAAPSGNQIHAVGLNPAATAGDSLTVNQWGIPVNANNALTSVAATVAAQTGPIGLDFSNLSAISGANTANTISQNGFGIGTLQNITVGQDGSIAGAFSNGQTETLGQLAMATFQNEEGLTRIGNSQFQASANSGLAQVGVAGSGRLGVIVSGALEESNVSMADEFTKMIAAQRAFQANSTSITTADQDLQTVIALKR